MLGLRAAGRLPGRYRPREQVPFAASAQRRERMDAPRRLERGDPQRDPARPNPQHRDHRPHRPRQVDSRRPPPRADGRRRSARHEGPVPRLDGSREGARDHDQGPERPSGVSGALDPSDRHARARRLRLRGLAQPRRLRGSGPAGGRVPGDRGADPRELLSGSRERSCDRPCAQQDRPARSGARAARRGDRARPRSSRIGDAAHLGEDGRGSQRGPGRGAGARTAPDWRR